MSFEVREEWASGARRIVPGGAQSRTETRPSALLGTIVVHLALFVIVVRHLLGVEPADLPHQRASQSLVLLDLSGPAPAASSPAERPELPVKPSDPSPTAPAREWQVVQVKTVQEAPPSVGAPAAPQPIPSAPPGGGYDPYAGAAPSRPADMATSNASIAPHPGPIADYMVNVFVQGFKIRHPRVRGVASIRVGLSPSGRVDRVVEIVGTIDAEGKEAIGREIVGEIVSGNQVRAASDIVTIGPLNFG